MKVLCVIAILAVASAELLAPEPVYLQEEPADMPQVYPVDARPMIVPPQVMEIIKQMDPDVIAYDVHSEGIHFVNDPETYDDSVNFINNPEDGYRRPAKIFVDPNLR